jgi:hypothetical protein
MNKLLFFAFSVIACCVVDAREALGIKHVVGHEIILIGKYYKDKSVNGYLIYDILKGEVDENVLKYVYNTPNLGNRRNGSAILVVINRKPILQSEKHEVSENGQIELFNLPAAERSITVEEIRKELSLVKNG